MSILSRGLHTVSYFIFCIAFLFSIGCSKQALVDPTTTNIPIPPPGSIPPLYELVNFWEELSLPVVPINYVSHATPLVVDNKVYVVSQGKLFLYDTIGGTWSEDDSDVEFQYCYYLFSYQSKAYFLKSGRYLQAYDVNTHTWADKADYPGAGAGGGACVSTATKGYIMGGQDHPSSGGGAVPHAENWEYDFVSDTWTKRANTPGRPRHYSCSFTVGDKIYFGTGITLVTKIQLNPVKIYTEDMLLKDWWEFNTSTNAWTQKADFAGGPRNTISGFVLNGKVYAGAGVKADFHDQMADLWQYDPGTNAWLNRKDCPIGGDIYNQLRYVGTSSYGYGINRDFEAFWQYKP